MIERAFRPMAILTLAALGSGCISVFPEGAPPSALYGLQAAPPADNPKAAASSLVVAVDAPHGQLQMGDAIVWRTGGSYAFMEGAVWAAPARELLQSMLTQALDESGEVRAATRLGEGARPDLVVRWTLTAFEIEESADGALAARFAATAQLLDARSRALLDVARVNRTTPLARRSASEAASALQASAQAGVAEFIPWIGGHAKLSETVGPGPAPPARPTPQAPPPAEPPRRPDDAAAVSPTANPL